MYKISKYVNFISDGDFVVMFNLRTDKFIVLNNKLGKYVDTIRKNIDVLRDKHPDLFQELLEKMFIIGSDIDEAANLVKEWESLDNDSRTFSIIINPTLGCNLRCWYCYEDHDNKPLMGKKVLESVFKLIDNKAKSRELQTLNVSFFGGEPLVGFDKVVKPVLEHASEKCKVNDISLTSNFTTNGVLLTDGVFSFLKNVGLASPASFQISLDGNRELHDKSRVGVDKAPTYDKILSNMKRAAELGFTVNARLNYTAENITSFFDVLDDFASLPQSTKRFINFNLQQVWQDKEKNDVGDQVEILKNAFQQEEFVVSSDKVNHRHCCYADRENSVVINYDGNVFKCTARNFLKEKRDGVLTEAGIIEWNGNFKRRMAIKYSNAACLACRILPICNGGCCQTKLEYGCIDTCFHNMDETAKDERIVRHFKDVVIANGNKQSLA